MDELELDGVHAEIERLAALHQSRKPLYSDRFLSHQTPGTEHLGAPQDAQLSHDDLLAAQRELAEEHGVSSARVRGMVMLTAAKAGLGHSEQEQAAVITEVALAMGAGKMNVSDDRILALSGRAGGDTIGALEDQRAAVRDEAMVFGLTVSPAERDRLVKSGHAMPPGGDFPVHDAAHLAAAKSEFRKGNLAGHSRAEVRSHINKNARRLGLPGLDEDGDHGEDDVAATMALTQESAAMALSAGQDSPDAVIARHPELAHLFKAGKTSSRKHPARSGKPVTTATRAHSSDLDEDPSDSDQPGRGGAVHRGVREIIEENPDLFSDGKGRAFPQYESHAPLSPQQREAGEVRQRAGHGGSTSIPDLARTRRRGSNTSYGPLPRS
jgi:hypothetical protein